MTYSYKWLLIVLFPLCSYAQSNTPNSEDTQAIQQVIDQLNQLLSISPGSTIDTAAVGDLFLPAAQLGMLAHPSDSMNLLFETIGISEFLELLQDPYYQAGYYETATGNVIEVYNGLATVFSSFYSKDSEGAEGRGVNSYQLLFIEGRWRIANLIWTTDSNGVDIPAKYLDDK